MEVAEEYHRKSFQVNKDEYGTAESDYTPGQLWRNYYKYVHIITKASLARFRNFINVTKQSETFILTCVV